MMKFQIIQKTVSEGFKIHHMYSSTVGTPGQSPTSIKGHLSDKHLDRL